MPRSLFNANDGLTGRDGGPYLDQVEAVEAEKRRAIVEGREPDLEHPPATAGIQLNTAAQMLRNTPVPHPSQEHVVETAADLSYKASVDEKQFQIEPFSEIPDEAFKTGEPPTDEEKAGPNIGDDLHAASVDGSLTDNSKPQTSKENDSPNAAEDQKQDKFAGSEQQGQLKSTRQNTRGTAAKTADKKATPARKTATSAKGPSASTKS